MNVARITIILFLLVSVCGAASCLKNEQDGSTSKTGPHTIRLSRRIALNEYLVPPPLPKAHSLRAGRVVSNPAQSEPPGYFSQFITWLNPFNYGSTPTTPQKSPQPFHETPHPPPPPQSYGPPQFNIHPPLQPGPPVHHHSIGPQQAAVPFYPPLGPPPVQHPTPVHSVPPGVNPPLNLAPGPSLNPPSPTLHLYNAPTASSSTLFHGGPPPKNNHGSHVPSNKGKACNPCNKVPWTPMQAGGLLAEKYPSPPQSSNAYLPPSGQTTHDVQYAASHEIKIPDFSQIPLEDNSQYPTSIANPMLYPGPMPPLYKAQPFDRLPQSPTRIKIPSHYEPPPLQPIPSGGQSQSNHETKNNIFNGYDNGDLTSSGVQVNQEGVPHQINGIENNNKELTSHKGPLSTLIYDTHPPISGPSFDQGYYNNPPPSSAPEQSGILNFSGQHPQQGITSLGSSSVGNQEFPSQSGSEYEDSIKPISGQNTGTNYLPPDLNPSVSYGTSSYDNQDVESFHHRFSDDLASSGSVVKDSHVQTTQSSLVSASSLNEGRIHYEESPLLDLTNKSQSGNDVQWATPTNDYTDVDEASDNTLTTTPDYNRGTDNVYFEDSSSFGRPTESYTSSEIHNINSVFGPSTTTSVEFTVTEKYQQSISGEASTTGPRYTNHQDVSYIPPSGQPGYLWPSLLLKAPDVSNDSAANQPSLNHFAQWNNSSPEVMSIEQQNRVIPKDVAYVLQKQQNLKRNKQVQVIIPYTSDYTPIPFQQSHGDWSVKTNYERAQGRKIPLSGESNPDNYLQQESQHNIRVINQLQPQFEVKNSNKLNGPLTRPLAKTENLKNPATKANSSIDVRRLQKNIDNWTIQEYSKPTTSSTILPSSLHPYLLPSKKIPTEYLTTTETADRTQESKDHNESVKTYSLAGFSFNEVEHEGSASNRVEDTRVPANVVRIDSPKTTASSLQSINKIVTEGKSTWEGYSVSISPVNKERVYVVTPQPKTVIPTKNDSQTTNGDEKKNSPGANATIVQNANNGKNNLSEFEAIEKAYQVLPQAVNNLAVASTGKENIPLWGIMEHEEFASLNLNENDEEAVDDVPDGPVLYTGHSKVSRAKR